ncbi:WXG100 family type VII secretion target, partial [Amycolatopsis thailandensis]
MTNPLVATPKDSTTAVSGVPLLESATELKASIESGDWASVAVGAFGTAMDAVSAAMDPFGTILAAGVGWLMEHVGPLKEALDALAGDPDEITAHAETWQNVADELASIGTDLDAMVVAETANWTGTAGDAYRTRGADVAALIGACQQAAGGASSGTRIGGEVVTAVRTLVRDTIAELIARLISWALQVLATLGLGMTWVLPQVTAAIA